MMFDETNVLERQLKLMEVSIEDTMTFFFAHVDGVTRNNSSSTSITFLLPVGNKEGHFVVTGVIDGLSFFISFLIFTSRSKASSINLFAIKRIGYNSSNMSCFLCIVYESSMV